MRRAKAQGKLKRRLTGTDRAQTVGRAEKGARESRDVQGVGKVADRTAVSTGSQRVQVEPKQEGKGSFSRDQKPGFVPREVKTGKVVSRTASRLSTRSAVSATAHTRRHVKCQALHLQLGSKLSDQALRSTQGAPIRSNTVMVPTC